MQAKQAKVERNEVIYRHFEIAVMKRIKIFFADDVLRQIYAFSFVSWMQFFVNICLMHKLFVYFLCFQRLAVLVDHKIKSGNLKSYRITQVDLDVQLLSCIKNLQILSIMIFQQRIFRNLHYLSLTLYSALKPSTTFSDFYAFRQYYLNSLNVILSGMQ